ncbi:MAG: hypothetical protein AAF333_08250 [Planctomycetota bacterium]
MSIRSPRLLAIALRSACLLAALGVNVAAVAQRTDTPPIVVPPAELGAPFGDPLVGFDAEMTALRVTTWRDGAARMLLLEGDASFRVGAYGFRGSKVVVRIEPQDTNARRVWHLAAYFRDAQSMIGAGSIRPQLGERDADENPGIGLLVTASTSGAVRLNEPGELIRAETPPTDSLVIAALRRIADRRETAAKPGLLVPESEGVSAQDIIRKKRRRAQIAEEQRKLYELPVGEALAGETLEGPDDTAEPERDDRTILPARGAVFVRRDQDVTKFGEDEAIASFVGNVQMVFEDYVEGRVVTLRAGNAVVFIDNQEDRRSVYESDGTIDAGGVQGVYLEENVIISDGSYTVRAPRVYYDLARDRATLLDAVFYTYDTSRQVPLYVRAQAVRQSSASDFVAENATLSTSEFAVPHFSVGAGELQVREYLTPSGENGQLIEARDTTLKLGGTPVFAWPYLAGYGRQTPLRRLDVGFTSDNGAIVETTWDLFAMLGKPTPDNLDARAQIDYLGEHGLGFGVEGEYNTRDSFGTFEGYFLPDDSGEDEIGGRSVNQEDEQRGIALTRNRGYLPNNFELSLEGTFVSDPTFLEEFKAGSAASGKTFETAAYLKWQSDDTAFDVLGTTNLSGFVEQLDALQSIGYSVERYPELTGRVIGGELLGGQLTWYSQNSFSQLRILAGDDAPEDRGFDDAESQEFFGVDADVSFRERAAALGLPLESVRRFDTRQELALPLSSGPIDITPYVVGRFTAYDEDFAAFNGGNDDKIRFWGETGLRLSTQLSKADGDINSPLLDLNGLRHVIEPNFTFFLNGSTLDPNDLPIYDRGVEDLAEGVGAKFGFTNTWQTRRGGPGRERTVDWLTARTDLILRSDDADTAEEIPRFYDYRPEFSAGGDHFYSELLWMVTDTLGVAGELTHSLESGRVAQWRLGATLDHNPRLNSFLNYEEIDVLDSRLLTYGFGYRLTTKYRIGFVQTLDFSSEDSRQIDLIIDRQLPRWTLRVKVGFDEIDDEQRISISLIPDGRNAGSSRFGVN